MMTPERNAAMVTLTLLLLCGALIACENPLHQRIIADVAPKNPVIGIKQGATAIENGGSYDVGSVAQNTTVDVVFRVENSGNADLILLGSPRIVLTQTGSDYDVTVQPESPIAPGESSDFTLAFTPHSGSQVSATVRIECNDGGSPVYTFAVSGTGTTRDINIAQGGTAIPDGTGEYDFGDVDAGNTLDVVFTLENTGEVELLLTEEPKVMLTGTGASSYTVTQQPVSPVAPDSSTQFTVRFYPLSGGEKSAAVEIGSNDPDENPYNFALTGTGIIPDAPSVTGETPTLDTTPTWSWSSGGGTGTYRYKLDDEDLSTGAPQTTDTEYEPGSPLAPGEHILYVQESNAYGVWTVSGSFSIEVTDVIAVGWIGGGGDGWHTGDAPPAGAKDYRSFYTPQDVFADVSGNIFAADYDNNRIGKWDSAGSAIGWIGGGNDGWQTGQAPTGDTGYRSFYSPAGVYIDGSGDIFVADSFNHRVSKWDTGGNAVGWIGHYGFEDPGWQTGPGTWWNSDYESFDNPSDVFVDTSGNIYIADTDNHRVSKWDSDGNAVGWIGGGSDGWQTTDASLYGAADFRSFLGPQGVHVDSLGNIYVADTGNDRICKWDSGGNAIGWIGGGSNGWNADSFPSGGTDYQSFELPTGVFVNGDGYIYVADKVNNRICKWDGDGNAVGWIGDGGNGWKTEVTSVFAFGTDYQSFWNPCGVFVDGAGTIYVADSTNQRICVWQD